MEPSPELSPEAFARWLDAAGGRAWLASGIPGEAAGPEPGVVASHPELAPLARGLAAGPDWRGHEAVFLAVAPSRGALFGAFLHRLERGQAQGGLRHTRYASLGDFLADGLRLARDMARKCALAGLWWGGGKGLIARAEPVPEGAERAQLYREYGDFVSSLRGVYVTAEDAGTSPEDVAHVFERTRFATCIPAAFGGSGNPSEATADGVVAGLRAALAATTGGGLAGRRVALQGLGRVGSAVLERVLAEGARVVAAEVAPARCRAARERFGGERCEIREAAAGDRSILAEVCDVLAPCALGGVLDAESVPLVRAALVCGAANGQLSDEARDGRALHARGVVWVPDFLVNRMGIVRCANEQYGYAEPDPSVARHLDPEHPDSIPARVRSVLERSRATGRPPGELADEEADARSREPHPIWGRRAVAIARGLVEGSWAARGQPEAASRRSRFTS